MTTRASVSSATAALLLCILPVLAGCNKTGSNNTASAVSPAVKAPGTQASLPPSPAALPNTGPINPALAQWKPTPAQFVNGPEASPRVALTFDAGSDAKAVPLIL